MVFKKGQTSPMKGKRHTDETKQKMKLAKVGKIVHFSDTHKQNLKGIWKLRRERYGPSGGNKGAKGFKHPKEFGQNISKRLTGHRGWSKGKHWHCKSTQERKEASVLKNLIRNCFKYRQWRNDIFTRDDYTCAICGKRGRDLVADHYPKTFIQIFKESNVKTLIDAERYEEFWNTNNGRTMCRECHRKQHRHLEKLGL